MKSRTHGTETTWTLDGQTITVFIPMTWKKRRSGQKVIIAPDGGDAWAPAKPRPDETLIRALARAHRWKEMLEAGKCRSITEIAETEKVDRAYVSRLLDLTLLAPDIQEAILEGRQGKGMQLEELTRAVPAEWQAQRDQLILLRRQEGGFARNQNRDFGYLHPDEAAE
jgi:hypothetical protein